MSFAKIYHQKSFVSLFSKRKKKSYYHRGLTAMADVSVNSNQQASDQFAVATHISNQSVLASGEMGAMKTTQTNAAVAVVDLDSGLAVVADVQHKTACVVTESGAFYYREIEEITMAVIEIGSLQKEETASKEIDDQQTCGEKCCAICTSRINGRKGLAPMVEIKPSTRKAQRDGKKWFKQVVFPLFSKYIREVVTYGNFLFAFVLFLITVITLAISSKKTIVDFVHVGFSTVSWLLTSMHDLIIAIYFHRCKLACDVYKCCKRCRDKKITDPQLEATPSMCCINGGHCDVKHDPQIEAAPSKCTCCADGGHCDHCSKLCCKNKYADLVRLLLIELFVYPITICSTLKVFLNIHLRSQDGIDVITGLSITGFAVSALWNVFFIYVLRSFVILRTICAIDKFRKDGPVAETARSFHNMVFCSCDTTDVRANTDDLVHWSKDVLREQKICHGQHCSDQPLPLVYDYWRIFHSFSWRLYFCNL